MNAAGCNSFNVIVIDEIYSIKIDDLFEFEKQTKT